jgi:phosphoglycolate phosphatase
MTPALLCDLDGTLVDTVHDLAAALNRLLAEAGLPARRESEVRGLVGQGAARLVADGFAAAGRPLAEADWDRAVKRFLAIYEADPAAHSPPYPGVAATLARLRHSGWRLGVCTNKPQAPAETILRALDLAQFFDGVGGGDRFPARKPDGAHVHATLELMGTDPAHAVLVGDSRIDLMAARDAGIPMVLVTYGYGEPDLASLGPAAVIDRFEALPDALAGLGFGG